MTSTLPFLPVSTGVTDTSIIHSSFSKPIQKQFERQGRAWATKLKGQHEEEQQSQQEQGTSGNITTNIRQYQQIIVVMFHCCNNVFCVYFFLFVFLAGGIQLNSAENDKYKADVDLGDYYGLLGLPALWDSTEDEIKKACK